MERFVQLIAVGGVALVGGLWVVTLFDALSITWLAGAALALLGTASLAVGIGSEIDL